MKQFGARWKSKNGDLILRWKMRKSRKYRVAPRDVRKMKDFVCYDNPGDGDEPTNPVK
jgi:hypothetical protein